MKIYYIINKLMTTEFRFDYHNLGLRVDAELMTSQNSELIFLNPLNPSGKRPSHPLDNL